MKIAVVTGASSGLGREFVKEISGRGHVDAIWVIARREERLHDLEGAIATPVVPIPLDLTKREDIILLEKRLKEEKPDVRILINAAGFGKMGDYSQISTRDMEDMIDLNCKALVNVTQVTLPYMRKGSMILEISSSSAFQPLPGLNVYSASKAFVKNYSRSLRWELFGRGIKVTAVCPYWIKNTEFIPVSKMNANPAAVRHFPLASRTRGVARSALRAGTLNLPVCTPGPVALVNRILSKFIPHEIVIACWEGIRRI